MKPPEQKVPEPKYQKSTTFIIPFAGTGACAETHQHNDFFGVKRTISYGSQYHYDIKYEVKHNEGSDFQYSRIEDIETISDKVDNFCQLTIILGHCGLRAHIDLWDDTTVSNFIYYTDIHTQLTDDMWDNLLYTYEYYVSKFSKLAFIDNQTMYNLGFEYM